VGAVNYVIMRQSPQWRAFDLDNTRRFLAKINWPEDMIIEFASAWNASFSVSFLEFRARVKEISIDNFLSIDDSVLVFLSQHQGDSALKALEDAIPEDAIVLFSDDDDWFHPQIFRRIQNRIWADGCYWDHLFTGLIEVEIPAQNLRNVTLLRRKGEPMLFTNNYALTGAAVRRLGLKQVAEHYDTQTAIREQWLKIDPVEAYLSAANKHPCSSTAIYHNRTDPSIYRDLRTHIVRYYHTLKSIELDADSLWLKPSLDQMIALVGLVLR